MTTYHLPPLEPIKKWLEIKSKSNKALLPVMQRAVDEMTKRMKRKRQLLALGISVTVEEPSQ